MIGSIVSCQEGWIPRGSSVSYAVKASLREGPLTRRDHHGCHAQRESAATSSRRRRDRRLTRRSASVAPRNTSDDVLPHSAGRRRLHLRAGGGALIRCPIACDRSCHHVLVLTLGCAP